MLLSKSTINSFRYIFVLYISFILIFALLYMLPISKSNDLAFVDSLFLSTSALSVTGLSSIIISEDLTRIGQSLLILEMQLGGIGILVLISYLFLMMGKRITMSSMLLISRDQNQSNLSTIKSLSFSVLIIALTVEATAFSIMFNEISVQYESIWDAVFVTAFHSVASFTNAGFDLFGDSLVSFKHSPVVLYTSALVIFIGSIGYPTIMEYVFSFKKKKSLFTRINIRMHTILLSFGFFVVLALEYNSAFRDLNWFDKISNAVFLSATARNGGLTTIDLSFLSISTILMIMLLMFIGGASSSTGGGIRLTTFSVICAKLLSVAKSREYTVILKKTITQETINKSFLIFISFILLFFGSTVILSIYEAQPIESIMFEVMSALTNTGLSMGLTTELATLSKCILMLLMVIGRIGIFSLIYFVFKVDNNSKVRYLKEDLAVG